MHIFKNINHGIKKIISSKNTEEGVVQSTSENEDMGATKIFKPTTVQKNSNGVRAKLLYKEGMNFKEFILGSARTNIGRTYNNEICVRDAKSSRLHAFIVVENACHVICDAKSRNGTYVNGKLVDKHFLQDNDRIMIGDIVLQYRKM